MTTYNTIKLKSQTNTMNKNFDAIKYDYIYEIKNIYT